MSVFRKENEIIGVDIDELDITDYASVEVKTYDALVKIILPKDANIHAKEYQLYLPDKELMRQKLAEWSAESEQLTRWNRGLTSTCGRAFPRSETMSLPACSGRPKNKDCLSRILTKSEYVFALPDSS